MADIDYSMYPLGTYYPLLAGVQSWLIDLCVTWYLTQVNSADIALESS